MIMLRIALGPTRKMDAWFEYVVYLCGGKLTSSQSVYYVCLLQKNRKEVWKLVVFRVENCQLLRRTSN